MSAEKIIEQIKKDSQIEVRKILQCAEKQANIIINNKIDKAKISSKVITDNGKKHSESIKKILLSKANQDAKRKIIKSREKIIEECFEKAQQKLTDLTGNEYEKFVTKLIKEGNNKLGRNCSIYITRDIDKKIANKLGVKVTGKIDSKGGIILNSNNGKSSLDNTIEGILSEKKKELESRWENYYFHKNGVNIFVFEVLFDPFNYPFWLLIISILAGVIIVVSRPFSTFVKFAYINALFEAIGNPFIEEKELSRILDSKNLSEFKDSLNSFKYYNIKGENAYEIQQSLDENFIKSINTYKNDSSKAMNDFFDAFIEKFDIYLIKNELKNKLTDKEINKKSIDRCILPKTKKFLDDLLNSEKDKLVEIVKNYGFGKGVINAINSNNIDFLSLDTSIDIHVFEKIKKVKVPHNCEKGKQKFVKTVIDIHNIKNILRAKHLSYDEKTCKKLFLGDGFEIASWKFEEMSQLDQVSQIITNLEGTSYFNILKDSIEKFNKERTVQIFENSLDSLYLKLISNISINNFVNIGPTIRFIVSKEFEIKNLKIISKGIGENINSDIIDKLLIKEAS